MKLTYALLTMAISFSSLTFAANGTFLVYPEQDACEEISFSASEDYVLTHPIRRIPESLSLVNQDGTVTSYFYAGWRRFYDSIITDYHSRNGERLKMDDTCTWDGSIYSCWKINGCDYIVD